MSFLLQGLFGEKSLTKLAAVLPSEALARATAQRAIESARIAPAQVRVLGPTDGRRARRELLSVALEPEQRGIWRTLWRAHLVLGVIGAAAGWALYQGFRASDNAAVLASPTASLVIMIGFGTVFGLLAGGLVTLRPDQAKLATSIRGALGGGSWVVLVHATHPDQITRAVEAMKVDATEVLRSL